MKRMPSLLHERLAEKLENLDEKKQLNIQVSLELLVDLLGIKKLEAFPLVSTDDLQEDGSI